MYCGFKIDADEGKILKWQKKACMYHIFWIKVCNTSSYSFSDKNGNTIYENFGICIKSWKEKKSSKKIINYLIQECMKINIEKNFIL